MELKPLKVSELTSYIKQIISSDPILNKIKIEGEVSNFKHHYSGHMYFTLKDNRSRLKCIMFNGDNKSLPFELEDGMKVIAEGYISIYERDGCYQLYVKEMKRDGIGDLYIKYEKLKKTLEYERLFEAIYKKEINTMPKNIGVITSSTGAAVKDIITVIKRRNPNINILIYSVHVQGIYSKDEICRGIKYFNSRNDIDTIIIGRGGGSIEELWSFNEEDVARAIYNSKIPIISAVGHETDFTISDFVSDLRAPTPSSAGELAVEDINFIEQRLENLNKNLNSSINRFIESKKSELNYYKKTRIFTEPIYYIDQYKQTLDFELRKLLVAKDNILKDKKVKLDNMRQKLNSLNPLNVLDRGFSYVEDNQNNVLKSVKNMNVGDIIKINFKDGQIKAKVIKSLLKEEF
ncbi:exodeoxyribonuclease VII large subunit [Senegalia massiliensis]|uniref:exodeoxyribonuclease VII large subunit n=1 Tax=Senegalia massiliensis TaxID=1720316 RepID=UPI00102FD56C|nr:exodeoxyribonuclease VII large subunit [Senegalia massiliensis]